MNWSTEQVKKFGDCLKAVGEIHRHPLSPGALLLYSRAVMAELDFQTAIGALEMHMRNTDKDGSFFPKPADLLRLVKGTKHDLAQLAWTKVDRAVRSIGTGTSVAFDDPVIHLVISAMGGWPALGGKTEEEWPFIANEFRQLYHGHASRGCAVDAPRILTGSHELANGAQGYDAGWYNDRGIPEPCPVIIGDERKARLLLEGGAAPRNEMQLLPQWLLVAAVN